MWDRVRTRERTLKLEVDNEALEEVSRLDGCYVIKTDFPKDIGGCPRIDFYCDRLQILMAALSSPKRPQRRLLLRLRPFWPCRLALKIFARSRYEAILGQPPIG